MGYGISTNCVYGVFLDSEEAKRLRDEIIKSMPNEYDSVYTSLEELVNNYDNNCPFNVEMVAEDSDSRIHDTSFEEGFDHVFGVVLASKGYGGSGSNEDFNQKMREGASQEQIELYNSVCVPLLKSAGLDFNPYINIVSYTA